MICQDNADHQISLGQDPVQAAMDCLAGNDLAPSLELLAQAMVAALPRLSPARHMAMAIDSDRASLLDNNWTRRHDSCLTSGHGQPEQWRELPGGWNPLVVAARRRDGALVQGTGPVPAGSPWADLSDDETGSWFLVPVNVLGHTIGVAILEMPAILADEQLAELGDHLMAVCRALGVVTELWADSLSLAGDLAQVRNEKQSLTRLNHLQGRFVAMASHEFKTPLTSITAYTDVLRSQLTDDEFPYAHEFLDVIKTEADRLLRMVNRIMDFTRMEYGSQLMNLLPTALEPLVDETIQILMPTIQDKKLDVSVRADKGVPKAVVDADLIRQVLMNLLGNAAKFTPHEGSIVVSIKEMESAVSVSVADDGPGIPAEDIRRVFREFYRADGSTIHEEGTGLGLTIARHIVNLHGGHIEVRRRDSGGADFRFLVPKEIGVVETLPEVLAARASSGEVRTLVDELLRLVAELTGSRAVVLLLRDGKGALVPIGAMGWADSGCTVGPVIENEGWIRFMQSGQAVSDPKYIARNLSWCHDTDGKEEFMFAPLGTGESAEGVVITGRRRETGDYSRADLNQLTILADVIKAALQSMSSSVGSTVEAIRLLLKIRRTGVPTSTPEALAMLSNLSRRLGVGETGTRRIQYASALHDAGMARVEEEIVLGGTKLNVDERDEVERHVEQGVDLMAPLLQDTATTDIMRHHHEKFDGTGYPGRLKGLEIPLGARMLAVIDAWFSLTQDRTFRDGLLPSAAMAEINSSAGTQFDPEVVREFEALLVGDGILIETTSSGITPDQS